MSGVKNFVQGRSGSAATSAGAATLRSRERRPQARVLVPPRTLNHDSDTQIFSPLQSARGGPSEQRMDGLPSSRLSSEFHPSTAHAPQSHFYDTDAEAADSTISSFVQVPDNQLENLQPDHTLAPNPDMSAFNRSLHGDDDTYYSDDGGYEAQEHQYINTTEPPPTEMQYILELPHRGTIQDGQLRILSTRESDRSPFSQPSTFPNIPEPMLQGAMENLDRFMQASTITSGLTQDTTSQSDGQNNRSSTPTVKTSKLSRRVNPSDARSQRRLETPNRKQNLQIDHQLPIQPLHSALVSKATRDSIKQSPKRKATVTFENSTAKGSAHTSKAEKSSQPHSSDTSDLDDGELGDDDTAKVKSKSPIKSLRKSHPTKQQEPELDYSKDDLKHMKASDLFSQHFDFNPSTPLATEQTAVTLEQKLAAIADEPEAVARNAFFASLSEEEWEIAGEWFVGQFGELAKMFTTARRERRKVAEAIEAEVGGRNRAVEEKSAELGRALQDMRAGGVNVLKGRAPGV